MTEENLLDPEFAYPSAVIKGDEAHGGEEVAVFAQGPWAHLFKGLHEESFIAYVMAYSACVGPVKDLCQNEQENPQISMVFVDVL